jgi:hypothetical protein
MSTNPAPRKVREARKAVAVPVPSSVGADPNLSHRADRILSQGWKPVLI